MATDQVCSCGASQFEGAAHKPPCVGLGAGTETRRKIEDTGSTGDWCRVKFAQGSNMDVQAYSPEGAPAEILTEKVTGIFITAREVESDFGRGLVGEVALVGGAHAGITVGFFCGTMLARLIAQVQAGDLIEVVRLADKGRMHQFEVYILGE